MIRKLSPFALGAIVLALGAQPALASTDTAAPRAAVSHSDLDLTTVQGRKELDRRVAQAARKVCTVPAPTGSLISRVDASCYVAARDSAKPRMAMLAQRFALRD